MIPLSLGATDAQEALRVVRALGAHRYVAGSLHLIHAFAVAAAAGAPGLAEATAWAEAILAEGSIDPASRDERLWRRSSDAELLALLDVYWTPAPRALEARAALVSLLEQHGLPPAEHRPFDESAEDEMHPILIDAGWELLALSGLDAERHRGAIAAFGDSLAFDSARFEEETAIPPRVHLYELPAIGAVELLAGMDEEGLVNAPLVVWAQGDETYLDYLMRGVRRAAKLPERE